MSQVISQSAVFPLRLGFGLWLGLRLAVFFFSGFKIVFIHDLLTHWTLSPWYPYAKDEVDKFETKFAATLKKNYSSPCF